MRLLIDGDCLVYWAGFHNQGRIWKRGDETFTSKRELNKYCKEMNLDINEWEMIETILPLEDNIETLETKLFELVNHFKSKDVKIYLGGEDNYRLLIDPDYKGNRDANHKPKYYQDLRDHLVKEWAAVITQGNETDDALGIEQVSCLENQIDSVIISRDKDLLMIPGEHYDFLKDERQFVFEFQGLKHFYKQLLTGDVTDNIIGLKGIGPKKSEKILKDCKSEIEMWNAVLNTWCSYPDDVNEIDNYMMRLRNNAQLLWIQRYEDERWIPPNER